MFGRATITLGIGPHSSSNIIRPHPRCGLYCYRPSSAVCLSVCLSVSLPVCRFVYHSSEPCKNDSTDRYVVWAEHLVGSKEPCVRWGPHSPMGRAVLRGGGPLQRYLCKNGWTDRYAVWVLGSDRPKQSCIRWGPDRPWEAVILGRKGAPIVKYRDFMPWAVQKRLNRLRCRFGCWVGWTERTTY